MTGHTKCMRPITFQYGKSAHIVKLHLVSPHDKTTSAEFKIKCETLTGWFHLDYCAFRTVSERTVYNTAVPR